MAALDHRTEFLFLDRFFSKWILPLLSRSLPALVSANDDADATQIRPNSYCFRLEQTLYSVVFVYLGYLFKVLTISP